MQRFNLLKDFLQENNIRVKNCGYLISIPNQFTAIPKNEHLGVHHAHTNSDKLSRCTPSINMFESVTRFYRETLPIKYDI